MSNQRIHAIEYIRGVAMLGVIGIHTGAYSLTNPFVNVHLFACFEILTRFSVPIFFFVSAFGLFRSQDLSAKFNYLPFMSRRLRTVLIPYLVWSLVYMLHYTWISGDSAIWKPKLLIQYIAFGLASYQLYFLVILLWFYSLMPLWRSIVRRISVNPLRYLCILLLLQIAVNYYSSYILTPNFSSHYINIVVKHRLSYWVIHYLFIFILGAVCAQHYQSFLQYLKNNRRAVRWSMLLSAISILGYYYFLLYSRGYTPEQAVNTAHQLSPVGIIYTVTATLFLYSEFTFGRLSPGLKKLLATLGRHSYTIYLAHPFVMYYLVDGIARAGKLMTAPVTLAFFALTVAFSLILSVLIQQTGRFIPLFSLLLTGSLSKPVVQQPAQSQTPESD